MHIDSAIAQAERNFLLGRTNSETCKGRIADMIMTKCESIHGGCTQESMKHSQAMYDAKLEFLGISKKTGVVSLPYIGTATVIPFTSW